MKDVSSLHGAYLIFLLFLSGCQADPNAYRYPSEKPNEREFVGSWTVKPDRVASSITLNKDGTFRANGLPSNELADIGLPQAELHGHGRWALKSSQDFWVLGLDWEFIEGTDIRLKSMLHIVGAANNWKILKTRGDPDEGRTVEFQKQSKSKEAN